MSSISRGVTLSNFWFKRSSFLLTIALLFLASSLSADDLKLQRGRMEDILDIVAKDVQKDFYDPKLKGLDWKALTEKARQRIREATTTGEMVTAIFALVNTLEDSHTVFIPPGRTLKVSYGFKAKPFGEDVIVYEVQKDGPATSAGLEVGDRIVGINDFKVERKSWHTMRLFFEELSPYDRMDLVIARNGSVKQIQIPAKSEPKRALVEFDTWSYAEALRELDDREPYSTFKDYEDGIKYVRLRTFGISSDQAGSAAKKLQHARAGVLDLRGNHGGSADAMGHFAGYFTPTISTMGEMVFRNKSEPIKIKSHGGDFPAALVVLVDSESASAAEMTARHLQLNGRARVVGDKSGGFVNAAQVRWEQTGAFSVVPFGVEIAVARVVMSNGEELENRGVTPDVFCVPSSEDLRLKKDPCLDKALALAREMATKASSVAAK